MELPENTGINKHIIKLLKVLKVEELVWNHF